MTMGYVTGVTCTQNAKYPVATGGGGSPPIVLQCYGEVLQMVASQTSDK